MTVANGPIFNDKNKRGRADPPAGLGVNEETTYNGFLLLKSYAGLVKLIYIDPPHNTGNDFIYPDDYSAAGCLPASTGGR